MVLIICNPKKGVNITFSDVKDLNIVNNFTEFIVNNPQDHEYYLNEAKLKFSAIKEYDNDVRILIDTRGCKVRVY